MFYDDEFGETTENKGHYTVQGHSRSPILVQIDFLLAINTNLSPILHRFPDIALNRSIFNHFYAVCRKSCRIRRVRAITPFKVIQGHIYYFPFVINTNLPHILHRFQDIAFDRSKIAIFSHLSSVQLPRRRDSPGTISVKFSVNVNGWPRYREVK